MTSVYIGVLSDPAGAQRLAKLFLQPEAGRALTNEDMADAIGEIANMLGGSVQRQIAAAKDESRLGLPIFVAGEVKPGSNVAQAGMHVRAGGVDITLVVRGPKG
jgi:CheY-specific phosphatase CheX